MDLANVPGLRPPPSVEALTAGDPEFTRASQWLARAPESPNAVVVGAPYGGGSISRAQCDQAPAAIRGELSRFSIWSSDHGVSLDRVACLDAGDIEPADDTVSTQQRIAEAVAALHAAVPGGPMLLLGGDNSVTVGGARGMDADGLLTFDAHHDCRDPEPNGPNNGTPVRQLVEGGMAHVVQIGIHGFSNAEPHARWAMEHRVHWVSAHRVRAEGVIKAVTGALGIMAGAKRIWVDFDLDVLGRAFAPGAAASMPGGLLPSHLEQAAFHLGRDPRVVGMDITELDPAADVANATVRAACGVMLAYLAGVASR